MSYGSVFFNHRAKRGGSLFEGGSRDEERSRSDPPGGAEPPFMVVKRPYIARGLPSVRQFFGKKLSQTSMDWNETWQECSLDQAGRFVVVAFAFRHQGVELLGAEGENLGVLSIFKGFRHYQGFKKGPGPPTGG